MVAQRTPGVYFESRLRGRVRRNTAFLVVEERSARAGLTVTSPEIIPSHLRRVGSLQYYQ